MQLLKGLLTIPWILLQFKNPSKWYAYNKGIVSGKCFNIVASVIYYVGITKDCK